MIATAHLFRPLSLELIALLERLPAEAWDLPTSAGEWCVRDVTAHLLDGDLRRLSAQRDGHVSPPPEPITCHAELVAYLNHLNRTWVEAARRVSPRMLVELLQTSTTRLADLIESSDPDSPATFPVAWAGEAASAMWFDMAREYTERWHHQDQIREATGAPPLADAQWLGPVLETSLRALPHAYRDVDAPAGTAILLRIEGGAGGEWTLSKRDTWAVHRASHDSPDATVTASDLTMSRLLLHRLTPDQARRLVSADGDETLVAPLLAARAVMVSELFHHVIP